MRHVRVWLEAGGKSYPLADQEYPGNLLTGAELALEREIEVVVKPKELGLQDGRARLMAEASDYAWAREHGDRRDPARDRHHAAARVAPDRTHLRAARRLRARRLHRRGGRRRSTASRWATSFFPGFVDPGDAKRAARVLRDPDRRARGREAEPRGDRPRGQRDEDRARDFAAGARASRRTRSRSPTTSWTAKVSELLTGWSGSPLDGYLKINRELRKENDAQLVELCKKSSVDRIWSGPFAQMPNTHAGARFAERRSYVYERQGRRSADAHGLRPRVDLARRRARGERRRGRVRGTARHLRQRGRSSTTGSGCSACTGTCPRSACKNHSPVAQGRERSARPAPPASRAATTCTSRCCWTASSSIRWNGSTRNGSTTTSRGSSRRSLRPRG